MIIIPDWRLAIELKIYLINKKKKRIKYKMTTEQEYQLIKILRGLFRLVS